MSPRGPAALHRMCLALFAVLVFGATPSQAAPTPSNGKIAYTCGSRVCTMNADGSAFTYLAPETGASPAWSPDGTKIAFNSPADGDHEIYVMNANGTNVTQLTFDPIQDARPAWSPDGSKITWDKDFSVWIMDADGSNQRELAANANDSSWSPDGSKIAVSCFGGASEVCTMNADGSDRTPITSNPSRSLNPDWGSSNRIVFARESSEPGSSRDLLTIDPDGTNESLVVDDPADDFTPSWSPDGKAILFTSNRDAGQGFASIYVMNADGSGQTRLGPTPAVDYDPDWQPVFTYPRPSGTSFMRAPLVPAFDECTTPNSTHGAPLSEPSCKPPRPSSGYLTVGTPDYNGKQVKSTGYVRVAPINGNPSTPADEADLTLEANVTDVRCQRVTGGCTLPLGDYAGTLEATLELRITDRLNGGSETEPGTVSDLVFDFALSCTGDSSTSVGSTCTASTSADAVLPGTVREGKRAISKVLAADVYDGGVDGAASTGADNTLFMSQGVFVP